MEDHNVRHNSKTHERNLRVSTVRSKEKHRFYAWRFFLSKIKAQQELLHINPPHPLHQITPF